MNSIISREFCLKLCSPRNFSFHFPSISQKIPNYPNPFTRKCSRAPKILTFCAVASSESLSYGGWDAPELVSDSVSSGESNHLHSLLKSLGINDRKYVFVYVLGFVCALAISRVKVSSFIAFPACMIVFVLGFTIGLVNGGQMSLNGTKKIPKDEIFRVPVEKLRCLVDLINEFDAKILNLKNDAKKGIECNHITVDDLESFVNNLELVNSSAVNAKSILEGCIDSILVESQEMERSSNQKSSRRKKDPGENQFSVSQFFAGLFQEKSDLKSNKRKDSTENELMDGNVTNLNQGNILGSSAKDRNVNYMLNQKVGNRDQSSKGTLFDHAETSRSNTVADKNASSPEMDYTVQSIFGSQQYCYSTNHTHYMKNERISLKNGNPNEVGTWISDECLHKSLDFGVSTESIKTVNSFLQEQEVNELEGKYSPFDGTKRNEDFRSYIKTEAMAPEDEPSLASNDRSHDSDVGSSTFSAGSDDMKFSKYLSEANILLKEAKDCLRRQGNDKIADDAFHKSAILLSKATDIRPMSLLAVGQLGNTYLLHGELKLRISRELRIVLTRTNPVSVDIWEGIENAQNDKVGRKEKLASYLVNVCEECEELLIKAGRQYRLALSIDGNDMRALYNWGLALSFRAQLIADIGPDAARDADKVFLAAIDKFDAMMSKSNNYAPDALFRWGAALQQRSRLRPRNSREKVRLLQQARRLFEDALDMDSDNLQVQKALSSCISELNWYN
nr:uncharacterized protein LOC109159165 [Ipomoea batatas]